MAKNLVIAALFILVLVLSAAMARLENYHYASQVGMCGHYPASDPITNGKRHACLHRQQTRTNPVWRLFYALTES